MIAALYYPRGNAISTGSTRVVGNQDNFIGLMVIRGGVYGWFAADRYGESEFFPCG